jgi:hypothetical protein
LIGLAGFGELAYKGVESGPIFILLQIKQLFLMLIALVILSLPQF